MKSFWILAAILALAIHGSSPQIVFPDDPPTTKRPTTTTTTTTTKTTTTQATTPSQPTTISTKTSTTTQTTTPIQATTSIQTTTKSISTTTTRFVPQSVSICVPVGECSKANLINDGIDAIEARIAFRGMAYNTTVGTYDNITTPASTGTTLVTSQTNCSLPNITEICVVQNGYQCGVQFGTVLKAPARNGTSPFGANPWEGLVVRNDDEDKYTFYATGALIDHKHFLTVASRVGRFANNASKLRIRLGEWNMASTQEIIPYQEFLVSDVIVHPSFNNSTMANNIAILRLGQNVPLGAVPTIGTACLPSDDLSSSSIRCMVAGFGRQSRTSDANFIIREIDQPLLNASYCQAALRNTTLGKNFTLDTANWLCAGGELQKSNCDGDDGNPLMCNVTGQFYVVGLFSWAPTEQNCGSKPIPDVYVNVYKYVPWIQSVTTSLQSSASGKVQASKTAPTKKVNKSAAKPAVN